MLADTCGYPSILRGGGRSLYGILRRKLWLDIQQKSLISLGAGMALEAVLSHFIFIASGCIPIHQSQDNAVDL